MGYEMGYNEDERDKEFRQQIEEELYTEIAEHNRSVKKVHLAFGMRPNYAEYILTAKTEDGQWVSLKGGGRVSGQQFPYPDNRGTWIVETDKDGTITRMIKKVSD